MTARSGCPSILEALFGRTDARTQGSGNAEVLMDIMFWVWLVLAAVLIIAEIFTAGFFLLWIGIAAAAAGLVTLLGGGQAVQWSVFIGVSLILWFFTRPFARRMRRGAETDMVGANRYLGLKGMVIEDIDNDRAAGMVRVEREQWRAEAADGKPIAKDTWVVVTGVTGARLVVSPAETQGAAGAPGAPGDSTDRS